MMKFVTHAVTIGPKLKSLPPMDTSTMRIRPGLAAARFCSMRAWPYPVTLPGRDVFAKSMPGFHRPVAGYHWLPVTAPEQARLTVVTPLRAKFTSAWVARWQSGMASSDPASL